jgi:DNA-binding NtrC family response regulator
MVREGTFREDLFHRLNVVQIVLPPLRERPDDVAILLQHFLERFSAEQGRDDLRLGKEVLDVLSAYSWPGNVRELVNCARYVVNLCQDTVVQIQDLPQRLRLLERGGVPGVASAQDVRHDGGGSFQGPSIRYDLPYKQAKRLWLEVFEFAYISRALKEHKGNVSHAARAAGIDRKSIQRLLKRNQMVKPGESAVPTEEGG